MNRRTRRTINFVVGLGIGGALGVLFAPKSGKETRKDLKKSYDKLVQKVKELDAEEVKESILDKIEEIKATLQDLDKEKVLDIAAVKAEQLKEKCEDLVNYTKEKATPIVERYAEEVREGAIKVTKQVLKKLEDK